jgi:hypothetical protein
MPDHCGRQAVECEQRDDRLGRVNRRASVQDATEAAAATVEPLGSRLVTWDCLGACRGIAMADHGRAEGVGCRNARRPAGANRCENLHREGEQYYGQEVLQSPAHRDTHPPSNNHQQSAKSRRGSGICATCRDQQTIPARVLRYRNSRDLLAPTPLPRHGIMPAFSATAGGAFPIVSQSAGILNNRC